MVWPDGSWAFSKLLGDEGIRSLASIYCILAAIGFLSGGRGDTPRAGLVAPGGHRFGRVFRSCLYPFLGWKDAEVE